MGIFLLDFERVRTPDADRRGIHLFPGIWLIECGCVEPETVSYHNSQQQDSLKLVRSHGGIGDSRKEPVGCVW